LICGVNELTQMVFGHTSAADLIAAGRVESSTRVATETASVLFPTIPFWRPPFDDLPST